MPKIFEYFGFVFFLYANDHKPLHVHVRYAEYESIIEFDILDGKLVKVKFKKSKASKQIPLAQRKEIEKFASVYYLQMVEKWTQFYLLKIKPKNQIITRKIS